MRCLNSSYAGVLIALRRRCQTALSWYSWWPVFERLIGTMDGNHAFGCTLLGLALTTLLVRIVFMSGPKMTSMGKTRVVLVALTVALFAGGFYLLSLPVDPATAARISEETYRFH